VKRQTKRRITWTTGTVTGLVATAAFDSRIPLANNSVSTQWFHALLPGVGVGFVIAVALAVLFTRKEHEEVSFGNTQQQGQERDGNSTYI
jgi:hypothetical protein